VRIRDFLLQVYDTLPGRLPEPLRDHHWRVRWSLLQVYFEKTTVHYEVWVQRKARRIEIGLHFEGGHDFSYRWAQVMAARMPEVQALLGPQVELEEWTPNWTRIHRTLPYEPLTEPLAEEVAQRLAATIAVLQPMLEEERDKVPDEEAAPASVRPRGSRGFRRRRRRH
jgi:hypothetical protein